MRSALIRIGLPILAAGLLAAPVLQATDVDGPDDCNTQGSDYGDAPEAAYNFAAQAYPGVLGKFPTCPVDAVTGSTQELACPPISTAPGASGFVRHKLATTDRLYWLGCTSANTYGLDTEIVGKMNSTGVPATACYDDRLNTIVDCVESAFGMSFGQDECYGDNDAGVAAPVVFAACSTGTVTFKINDCEGHHNAYLNILVDWNEDGDWNDNFACPSGCAYEWAVKNFPLVLNPGCNEYTSPVFATGPKPGPPDRDGRGWMRITIGEGPMPDDFPWNGTVSLPLNEVRNGETEDYPVTIRQSGGGGDTCDVSWEDFGDAPENLTAYADGTIGRFPTCTLVSLPSTQELGCAGPVGVDPTASGYVRHLTVPGAPLMSLGCGDPASPGLAVDSETDGKVRLDPVLGLESFCDPAVLVDCALPAAGLVFGQDECWPGDGDAGVAPGFLSLSACSYSSLAYDAYLCEGQARAFLNVLADWNQDGDWNDRAYCDAQGACAPEWAVKNAPVLLAAGCNTLTTPKFMVGPNPGEVWLRLTLSDEPATDDFPWNGTAAWAAQSFRTGETEDYVVKVGSATVGVGKEAPSAVAFLAPTPNPARDQVTLRFALPREGQVSLAVFDLGGRRVAQLALGPRPAGLHTLVWDFRDGDGGGVPAGIYLARLEAGGKVLARRVIRVQ